MLRADGSVSAVEETARTLSDGTVVRVVRALVPEEVEAGARRANEETLSFMVNAVPACLSFVDAEGRYVWVNEFYRGRFGLDPDAFRGRYVREIIGPAGWTAIRPHVERALSVEEAIFETRLVDRAGRVSDISAAYVPQRDPSGRVRGFMALITDVSERKRAEESLLHMERMLEESQTAARVGSWEDTRVAGDPKGGSLRWSAETYRIFGYDPAKVVIDYATFLATVHPDDRAAIQATGGRRREGRPLRKTVPHRAPGRQRAGHPGLDQR